MNTLDTFKLLNVFQDDHCPCAHFNYRGKSFGLWWTDIPTLGAFEYRHDAKASKILQELAKVLDVMIDNPINPDEDIDPDDNIKYTDYGYLDYE